MSKEHPSLKRLKLDKANRTMVIVIGVSTFMIIFSLLSSRALWVRQSYQTRVIAQKEAARDQLRTNIKKVEELSISYKAFVETPENIIGGGPRGTGERDGDNAKIILDALPSKYDFPALTTSLEKIIKNNNTTIVGISGSDDEVAQSSAASNAGKLVEIPFEISASGTYQSIQKLLTILQHSIRPFQVQKLELAGTNEDLKLTYGAKTYYQPEKALIIQKKEVKL